MIAASGPVAARAGDESVELGVGVDERLEVHVRLALEDRVHDAEHAVQLGEVVVRHARRGEGDALGLEHAPDGEHVGDVGRLMEVGEEPERAEQRAGIERGHVGAVALPGLEHAERGEGAHPLAQRATGDAELGGEVLLDRQARARRELAAGEHPLDALDHDIGLRARALVLLARRP